MAVATPPALLARLQQVLGDEAVLYAPRDLEVYSYDATLHTARPDLVVLPTSTQQVAEVVRACAEYQVPITPRGSATSLSGGPLPLHGGVVVSLTRMADILEVDEENLRAVVQAGVINADFNEVLAERGLMYAPDPASQIACSMGGNVAENAGGPHCLKYGVTVNHVLGLTAVTAAGEVVQLGGRELLTAGLDLRGLLVGSEGTLGLITEIVCRLLPLPEGRQTIMACFGSVTRAAEAVSEMIAAGLLPATIEMIDRLVIEAIEKYDELGYPDDAEAVLIVEVDGLKAGLGAQSERVEKICRRHGALRLEVAATEEARQDLWRGRKGATAALSLIAPAKLSTDVTVPRTRLAEALAEISRIGQRFAVPIGNVFHAGDGNLHPQVLFDPRDEEQMARALAADHAITEMALRLGGVLTGEHGIGSEKRKWMIHAFSQRELAAFWAVKKVFDPEGVLNPGKVLPEEEEVASLVPFIVHEAAQQARPGLFTPTSESEALDLAAACQGDGQRYHVRDQSGLGDEDVLALDLARLNQVLDYDADNLTITVGAGASVAELQRLLAEYGQTLSTWRLAPSHWTLGRLVARAWPSPALARYGSARDVLLGLHVAAEGRLLRLGSTCVKNVAGYALERLFVGSFCSLGLILAVTLRTHPLPEAEATLEVFLDGGQALLDFTQRVLRSGAAVAWTEARPLGSAGDEHAGDDSQVAWRVVMVLEGWREEVQESASIVEELAAEAGGRVGPAAKGEDPRGILTPPEGQPKAREGPRQDLQEREEGCVLALQPLEAVQFALQRPGQVAAVNPLAGLVYVAPEACQTIQGQGWRFLPRTARELYGKGKATTVLLSRELKKAFDPQNLLPPWHLGYQGGKTDN